MFRLGAACHHLLRSKLNRVESPGVRKIDQKSLPLVVVLAEPTEGWRGGVGQELCSRPR